MSCNCSNIGGCSCTGNSSTLPIGPKGDNGTQGIQGLYGGFSQEFAFSTSTSTGPTTPQLRFNNVDPTLVTKIYVSDTNADGSNAEPFLNSFLNGGVYGFIRIFKKTDSTKFWYGKVTAVTDNGADHTLDVIYLGWNFSGSAPFVNTDPVVLSFAPSAGLGYKTYVANLAQSGGGGIPTATVLQNTMGGTIVWTVVGTGVSRGTLAGVFPDPTKVVIFFNADTTRFWHAYSDSVNSFLLITEDATGIPVDGMTYCSIEVRVYP